VAADKVLKKTGATIEQMELIEIQEAFAAQVLADLKEMGVGPDDFGKVNVNGSGISLGHPIAATGTRVLVSLLHEMRRRGTRMAMSASVAVAAWALPAFWNGNSPASPASAPLSDTVSNKKLKGSQPWISNFPKNMKCCARPYRISPRRKSPPSWTNGMPNITCPSKR
jgi:hypothetical protein